MDVALQDAPHQPAVFLDRDGVLNRNFLRGGKTRPPSSLAELEILPGVPEAARQLADAGFALVVVTNQPDVARGATTLAGVEEINSAIRSAMPLLDVFTCCHDDADNCACRKPRPGMLFEAARRWRLDLNRSFLVGDRWSDVAAGQAAGCRTVLVHTPHSGAERCRPDHTVTDLTEAAQWIIHTFLGEAHEAVR
jgi:D-glycero-D-manno-heptose 1,7-bisphosphate phosphatase